MLRPSRAAKPSVFDPASGPAYAIVGVLTCIVGGVVASGRFAIDDQWAIDIGATLVFMVTVAWLMRRAGLRRLSGFVEAIALFFTLAILAPLCAVVVASTDFALADASLRRADLLLGFDRTVVASWLAQGSTASRIWGWIYNSLMIQPLLLLGMLFASGLPQRAWTLLTGWGASLLLSLSIFPFAPAFGTPPYVLDFIDVLEGARNGDLRILGVEALTGIITFPSFHAAAATMLAWGFLAFGRAAWPMVAVNVAMFASALVVGGHYLVDLPAGALVAILSIAAARALVARKHRTHPDEVRR